jgi:Flp pilus assembly protein TadD
MTTSTVLDHAARNAGPAPEFAARVRPGIGRLAMRERVLPLLVVLAVVAVFGVALRNEFVHWDDYNNLVDNPHFRGLGWTQLRWMFTTTLMGHYIPVTWLTFGLDYVIWGMQPAGYHLTNLILHALNATLVYWAAKRMLVAAAPAAGEIRWRAGALTAASFFAIHPLRAESVAWATERRDVLSSALFLACILLYLRATSDATSARRRWLTLSVVSFALAMMAKSIVMTLPVLLLVIDWYPLSRIRGFRWSSETRRVLLEKLPFAAVGLAGGVVSYWAVSHHDYLTAADKYPLSSRIAMALYSMVFYLSKTVLPVDLSPLYELPSRVDPLDPQFLGAAVAVVMVTFTLIALAHRWPAGLAAYAWYAIVLAPVGGLVHAGHQLAHDRYSYVSCLPFAVLLGGGVVWLIGAYTAGRLRPPLFLVACGAVAALLVTLGTLTWLQVQVWRDTESLWTQATFATPECSICHDNYGAVLVNHSPAQPGDLTVAIEHFQQALMLKPEREKPYGGLGLALIHLGRPREAESALRRALNVKPEELDTFNNLGYALNQQGRFEDAIPYLRRAIAMDGRNIVARTNLGAALVGTGRTDEAIVELQHTLDQEPFAEAPRSVLVRAYEKLGNTVEAHKQLTILRQLHPATATSAGAAADRF